MALLKSLTLSQLEMLRGIGSTRSWRKNESVYELGHPTEALYLVLGGRARLRDKDRDNREITVSFAAEGEAFGLEALAGLPGRVSSASAAENSEFLAIQNEPLRDLLTREPALARHLLRHTTEVMMHMEERTKMLAFLDVPSRLAGTILWLADRYGHSSDRGVEVPYWFTHQEMADLIGSTRETVTTVLADLRRNGLVTSQNHHFVVLDRDALKQRIALPGFAASFAEPV
jgi:CRP-like cAMP-binding protein